MSAIRLRTTSKGLEIRVDDETPISTEPIILTIHNGYQSPPSYLNLTIEETGEVYKSLGLALDDALR